jgi:hypothetical protein
VKRHIFVTVCLMAAMGFGCRSDERSEAPPPPPLTAIEPSAETDWPFDFRWEGADAQTVVRVHVLDEAERPLYGIEARGDHVAAPRALEALLEPGARYQWRVARVDPNGEESGASALTAFTRR